MRPRAQAVQLAGDELLAGPALAGDQHGGIRLRDLVDRRAHLLHRNRLADHRAVREPLGQLAVLALVAVAGQEFYALMTLRYFRSRLEPVAEWIGGERSGPGAIEAWRNAASAPYQLLRQWWRGGYPFIADLAWCLFATWLLGLPAWAIAVLYLAAATAPTPPASDRAAGA